MSIVSDPEGNLWVEGKDGSLKPAEIVQNEKTGTKAIWDNGKLIPLPGQEPSVVGSALRGVVQGATFGFGDEMRAGVDALVQAATNLIKGGEGRPTMGEAYDKSLAKSREDLERDKEFNPYSAGVGQVYGGVGTAVLGAPVAAAARGAAIAAPGVARAVSALPTVTRNPLMYTAGGAAAGGTAGFGEGEGGFAQRAQGAGIGAAVGGVVAPVAGAVASAVPAVAGRLTHGMGLRNPQTAADRQILRSMERGGVSLDDATTRLNAAGDTPLALVDVGGRNTVNLGATASNTPSQALDVADAFVESRRAGRPDRLMNAGDEAFGGGSGDDLARVREGLRDQRRTEAAPLYERAFRINPTPDEYATVARWVNDPIGQEGMQRGLRVIELEHLAEGRPFNPADFGVTREGGRFIPIEGETPNMRLLDAVKRGYDEIVEDFRSKETGRLVLNGYGRAVDQNRHTYRNSLAELFHPYRRALEAWAGPSAQLDAIQAGKTAFRTDRDIVADRMSRAADERDAYRLGAGRDFADRVSDPGRASEAARKLFEDHQMQARLNRLLEPGQLDRFNTALRSERDMTAVERAVSPRAGSQTARLSAGGTDMKNDPSGPVMAAIRQAVGGHPWQALGTVGSDLWRRGQGINPATADALANRLFATDPAARQQVTDALRNRLLQDELRRQRARQVVVPALAGLSAAAGGGAAGYAAGR